jgi:hypothetical protein
MAKAAMGMRCVRMHVRTQNCKQNVNGYARLPKLE